ncbi:MAG: metallophosphoesterase family protein [Candidatus Hodarchaeota archaeon]
MKESESWSDKMHEIGILSDTRLESGKLELPVKIQEIFKNVELIIHAGNIYKEFVLEELEKYAPVVAIKGNGDEESNFSRELPRFKEIKIGGFNIGIFHEKPGLEDITKRNIDILITGNTCIPKIEESREIRLSLNPGSPTFPKKYKNGTVILLKIDEDMLFSYIIKL